MGQSKYSVPFIGELMDSLSKAMGVLELCNVKMEELQKYATDLTMLAEKGKLDPVIGREMEMELLVESLLKRRNSNACLVGPPGVGKTAIVQALAAKIAAKSAPHRLTKKKVFSIDMDLIVDGAMNRWEVEKRVKSVLEEVRGSEGGIILFIDNLHDFISEDGVATILKRSLSRDKFQCIGATTQEEYRRLVESDGVLKCSFDTVYVREASIKDTIKMVEGIIHKYANYHGVSYSKEVITSAVALSKLHIRNIYLPGKAIAMIDKAGARALMLGHVDVTDLELHHVVFGMSSTGVNTVRRTLLPDGNLVHISFPIEEPSLFLNLERIIADRIIGQDEAVSAVCRSICNARVCLRDETKPIGCFLFAGPTGVGKTELAKVLAEEYYGSKAAMVRIDTRQCAEHQTIPRLVGQLIEEVRQRPDSLVLFDGIEKAHVKILDVLLEILDHGTLSDDKGGRVDFSRSMVIVISNSESKSNLEDVFKAEVLDRFDQVLVLKSLEKEDMEKILQTIVDDFRIKVSLKNLFQVQVTEKVMEFLISVVEHEKSYNARTLKRAFTDYVESKLAGEILAARRGELQLVIIDIDPTHVIRCQNIKYGEKSDYNVSFRETKFSTEKSANEEKVIENPSPATHNQSLQRRPRREAKMPNRFEEFVVGRG